MSGKRVVVSGVETCDIERQLDVASLPSHVRRLYTDRPARDEILSADPIPKVIALGTVWNGLKGPLRDELVSALSELGTAAFTPGNVLEPEDVAGYAMIRLGRVWNGLSLSADEKRRAMSAMRDAIFESAGRLSVGATTAAPQELADLAMGTFEKKMAGNSTPTADSNRGRIQATQRANEAYRQQKAAAATQDASRSVQPPSLGRRMSIAEINAANRAYTASKRSGPI